MDLLAFHLKKDVQRKELTWHSQGGYAFPDPAFQRVDELSGLSGVVLSCLKWNLDPWSYGKSSLPVLMEIQGTFSCHSNLLLYFKSNTGLLWIVQAVKRIQNEKKRILTHVHVSQIPRYRMYPSRSLSMYLWTLYIHSYMVWFYFKKKKKKRILLLLLCNFTPYFNILGAGCFLKQSEFEGKSFSLFSLSLSLFVKTTS